MLVSSIKHFKYVMQRFSKYPWITFDTETESTTNDKKDALVIRRMDVTMFSICHKGEAYSIPVKRFSPEYPAMYEYAQLLRELITKHKLLVVMHNANYDVNVALLYSWRIKNFWDTMIASWLVNTDVDKSLKAHAPYLGQHQDETKTIDFSNKVDLARYAEQDVIITDELYQAHVNNGVIKRPRVVTHVDATGALIISVNPNPKRKVVVPQYAVNKFHKAFLELQEFPVLKATIRAEQRGVPVSRKRIAKAYEKLLTDKKKLVAQANSHLGARVSLTSTAQVAERLFELGVPLTDRTPTGKWKLAQETLFMLKGTHSVIDVLINLSKLNKLESTYMNPKGLPRFIQADNRIHCNLNTVGAVTGRFSSSNPNLQNIPSIKDIYGLKKMFVAPKGKRIICLDFGQIEIRVMALFCKDAEMTSVLCDPTKDMHTNTATKFGVPRDPVAKFCNFNIQYKGGAWMLAHILTLAGCPTPPQAAQSYIDSYNSTYPGVSEFRERMYAFHRKHGFFPYLTGRTRSVVGLDANKYKVRHKAETQLINNIIQGSAQDLLKAAIIRTDYNCINPDKASLSRFNFDSKKHRLLIKDYSRKLEVVRKILKLGKVEWILQVHDEVLYLVDESAAAECANLIADVMTWHHYFEPVVDYTVPIICDGGVGDSWGAAKKDPILKVKRGYENWV